MNIFNKINDVLIVDAFENVFQRRSSEVLLPDVLTVRTIQNYMLHCHWSDRMHMVVGLFQIMDKNVSSKSVRLSIC